MEQRMRRSSMQPTGEAKRESKWTFNANSWNVRTSAFLEMHYVA